MIRMGKETDDEKWRRKATLVAMLGSAIGDCGIVTTQLLAVLLADRLEKQRYNEGARARAREEERERGGRAFVRDVRARGPGGFI
mmetsp:Transcript_22766/g.73223  ORF Transcript_22766/g.73223 Transcript_22766/m.73223 type:complete len:85 (+) Transcript_22766:590-844(+)